MINVSEATKTAYRVSTPKTLVLNFPNYGDDGLVINTGNLGLETFELTQILEKEKYLTFTGCNAAQLKVTIARMAVELKGEYVEASIQAGSTDVIPLFKGYVDTQTIKDYATSTFEIVAYDVLYSLSSRDIAEWYISLWNNRDTITLKDFRDLLFQYLGITVVSATLVNDTLTFKKEYSPQQMNALDVIRSICQINGVYGLINRYGRFEFRVLPIISGTGFPVLPYYKKIDYQRWAVVPITRVIVRQNEDVAGGVYGSGNNTYIVQGNIFTMNLSSNELTAIAQNIYANVENRAYIPYTSEIQGYPWMEVGDIQTYPIYDYTDDSYVNMNFYIINRVLKGIQALTDTQSAEGEEYRTVFISSINVNIDTIKQQIESIQGKLSSMSLQYVNFYNEDEKTVGDGETRPIVSNTFSVMSPCQVRFDLEYLLQCETTETDSTTYGEDDLTVTVFYELDGTIIDSRTPKETYQDGDHILSTYYIVNVPDMQSHTWRVLLKCEGGEVTIPQLQAMNTLLGLGSIVENVWDELIEAEDVVSAISLNGNIFEDFTDSASISFIPPTTPSGIADTIPALGFNNIFGSFTDSASAEAMTPPTTGAYSYYVFTKDTGSNTATLGVLQYRDGYLSDTIDLTKTEYSGTWKNFDNMIRIGFGTVTANNWTIEILGSIRGYEVGDTVTWSYSTTKNLSLIERV